MPQRQVESGSEASPSTRRLLTLSAFFIALSAAGLYAIYNDVAGRTLVFDTRLLAAPVLIALGALLLLYYLADGLRLHFTLRALGHRLALRHIFRLVFINIFFSNVTPLASGGGFAQIWYLQRHDVPLGTATTATTIRTALALAFIFSATPVMLLTLDVLESMRLDARLLFYLAVFIGIYLALFAVIVFRTRWLLSPYRALLYVLRRGRLIGKPRHRRWRIAGKREIQRFARGFKVYASGRPFDVLLSVLFTLLFLLSLFSFPALLLWALDYDVPYLTVIGLMVVTTFTMYFSPTPGAAGFAEGVFGYLFAGLIAAGHIILITLAWRFLTIYLGMLIGAVVMQMEIARGRHV